jgi:hypothetical protein
VADTTGRLGYLAPMAERPINHPDPELCNLIWDWRDVSIRDARDIPGGATLRRNGFTALPHPSAIRNWDGKAWQAQFTLEIVEILGRATGATEIAITRNSRRGDCPFVIRSSRLNGIDAPVSFVHNDYSPGSASRHLAADYPDRAQRLFAKRFAIYNVWRLISEPPQSHPLAVCDPTSVAAADLVACEAYTTDEARRALAENALFRFNPAHRWYYHPDLRTDETLVWCAYDSDPSFPSIAPHAAFHDPGCADPVAERTSLDGTVYAFFD